jgi:hypothetical protein
MDINPKQIRCAYWILNDYDKKFEVIQCQTVGSPIQSSEGKNYYWILIVFSNNAKVDNAKVIKAYIDEDGVPYLFKEIN